MPVGNQTSWSQLNTQAAQVIIQARNALQAIIFMNLSLQSAGQAGLTALAQASGENATDAANDAATLLATFADLNNVAQMCNGGPAPANVPRNFLAETAPFWGGS